MEEFDLFVIGAGSGGVRCARIAARSGARVGIVEARHWGGTCVNLGCVPKKLMVYASEYGGMAEDARAFGWDMSAGAHDWSKLIAAKDREIARLNGIYVSLLETAGVTLMSGHARFLDAHTLEIGASPLAPGETPRRVRAKAIVIATGSQAVRPGIPGAELGIVSDDAFHLPARPERIAIIGAGYIGVEFAGIFAGLGSHVDLVYRQDLPLRGFDEELRASLAEALPGYGIALRSGHSPRGVEKLPGGALRLDLGAGETLETDCVFFATGRAPNLSRLDVEAAGVTVEKGRVVVDDAFRTSVPHIYAIGDVTDRYNLTPTAIAEGHMLAERLFGGGTRDWSFATTPKAVFFSEPLSSVGLTEEEAARETDLDIYTARFRPLRQTLTGRDRKTFMKLVVCARTQVVLGAHMMGDAAPELMQGLAIAVTARLTKRDFDRTIGIHPTTAEEIVTMRSPARHVKQRAEGG
ncbi:glutathione-disulfide reductase [Acidomonas methanolica]|uniref:Dihydrolipoamide dehydrogenase/glutathione reductase n=1 Tax=Acidomonas methanolica NBRC 104435 TaxID=1231351 RepID=A0A023D1W2_ACIMT|nr:glutathione-disulfide reductase [Acidomonas methanolica]MBU2654572.1 glutathione-disulfide reductase [Acidomonas methanolica]TCS27445.1 glutathione reductase (NADPH) [Acidomonas methanolica]GAJ28074.1 dihydrolipoamide dehydrogenase/glutathione reductase [Acidomonas methanolica NBRC 104435]GBQ51792.1 glutathione reductase [Acidomonas methanolica]GEK98648.1 glutathione reductase [Acidomonas methanolica NBRC 104435]